MTTLAASISDTGISAPTYADILVALQASFQGIYGSDVYLGPDSQDGQLLGVFAQAINDCNAATIAAYNACSPATAQGTGLSSVVKINGIARLVATNSTADMTIIGQAGTTISNGVVRDVNNNQWALPASVVIPLGGQVVVQATATQVGALAAPAGTISRIATPTLGWQSAINLSDASKGSPVESDAALRVRQSGSVALAAQTMLDGICAAITNLTGVTRIKAYANDGHATDYNGIPPHAIALVVDGGDPVAIAAAIFATKGPGTGTYGTTAETVINTRGVPDLINFFRPVAIPVTARISIRALRGYVSSTGDEIVAALWAYIDSLGIGADESQSVELSRMMAAAYATSSAGTYNVIGVSLARGGDVPSSDDLPIAFNELPEAGAINLVVL